MKTCKGGPGAAASSVRPGERFGLHLLGPYPV